MLGYISSRRKADYLPGDRAASAAFRVRTIESFTLSDLMFVNADTLASLQIIQSENHPNSQMQGPNKSTSGAKENLSVFGLFVHLAHTPQGKQKLRQIFLRPSTDLTIIEERLHTIGILLKPDNSTALETLTKSLKMIRDIRTVVIHLQKGVTEKVAKGPMIRRGVWGNIQHFAYHALTVLRVICELSEKQTFPIATRVRIRPILQSQGSTSHRCIRLKTRSKLNHSTKLA